MYTQAAKDKFFKGQRVAPTKLALEQNLWPKSKIPQYGVVAGFGPLVDSVSILCSFSKTPTPYCMDFWEPIGKK